MAANTIHQEQIAALRGSLVPIQTRWSYQADEPFAVTVSFCAERGRWVEWVFARDLLITGLERPSGIGDLRVRPGEDGDTVILEVHSPNGEAAFELDRADTEAFVNTTLNLVPEGTESDHFDFDRLLEEIADA